MGFRPVVSTLELKPEPIPATGIARRLTLALDIAGTFGRLLQEIIGRLDEVRRFEVPQEIACAYETHSLVNDRPAAARCPYLKEQKRFSFRIPAQKAFQNLERGLFAERTNGSALLDAALLVDTDLSGDDYDPVEVSSR